MLVTDMLTHDLNPPSHPETGLMGISNGYSSLNLASYGKTELDLPSLAVTPCDLVPAQGRSPAGLM